MEPGDRIRQTRVLRLLLAGLVLLAVSSVWRLADWAPRGAKDRHRGYYRLARDLDGATLELDRPAIAAHGWAIAGLGDVEVAPSPRRPHIAAKKAATLQERATYRTRLGNQEIDVLLDPAARRYVLARVDKQKQLLIVPRATFLDAGGKLR